MRRALTLTPRDPDFDRHPPTGARPGQDVVAYYQRIVVNPFLGVVAFSVTGLVASGLGSAGNSTLIPPLLVVGGVAIWLSIQYHCLDCGLTGTYRRWKRHACQAVRDRWTSTNPAWHRFPSAHSQLVFWVMGILIIALVVGLSWRR